jgi:hypothetical protein
VALGGVPAAVEGSVVDAKEQEKRFLMLGHTIARQAVELPPQERKSFIGREVNDLRQMYEPIYKAKASSSGRELLESMEGWVTQLAKILEKDA